MSKDNTPVVDNRKSYVVNDGEILVFSDLHLSSTYEGTHKNYAYECYYNMEQILAVVKKRKPVAVFFFGDLIGVRERNLKDRQFMARVVVFFRTLNTLTKGNVFSVKGNHDIGDFSDFDFLVSIGYLKNPKFVDYYHDGSKELRFHFVNYGDENFSLSTEDDDFDHIVLGHADYYIEGLTTWYSDKKNRVELKTLKNFEKVSYVFSGHIHSPSKEMLYTYLPNGEQVGLFYPGSPSRTAEKYDDCWYLSFSYDTESMSSTYDALLFGLEPFSKVFHEDSEFIGSSEEEEKEKARVETLNEIIQEIFSSRLATGDLIDQIDRIPAKEKCKDIAKSYIRKAIDEEDN